PERVAGLMLLGSKTGLDSKDVNELRLSRAAESERLGRSEIPEPALRVLFSRRTQRENPELLRGRRQLSWPVVLPQLVVLLNG
ncbi:MAG: hypothetical protein M3R43_10300, partial [Acidobacteriota bacterium]|nr:hypothetical protein [Acidobacteriota bacterium]